MYLLLVKASQVAGDEPWISIQGIFCIVLVCSDGPIPMHAPSELLLGGGVEAPD
jgi:hypothetical protein